MTALSALRRTKERLSGSRVKKAYLMKASTQIWAGGLVGIDADGLAVPLTTSCVSFAGVAAESVLSAASGSYYIEVYHDGEFSFAKTGTIVQANVGEDLYGADDQTLGLGNAYVETNMTGAVNNDLRITAVGPAWGGQAGEDISFEILGSTGNGISLSVEVNGTHIVVTPATDGGGTITSTGATVLAAVNAHADAALMVLLTHKSGNDGTGLVAAHGPLKLALPGVLVGKLTALDSSDVWCSIRGAAL